MKSYQVVNLSLLAILFVVGCKPEYKINRPAESAPKVLGKGAGGCSPSDLVDGKLAQYGSEARAKYLRPEEIKDIRSLSDLKSAELGISLPETFSYHQIDVTPRMATQGYPSDKAGSIPSLQGQVITEYLNLNFSGFIGLNKDQEAGNFELGLLADDGAILEIFLENKWQAWVNNDGLHAVKMACAKRQLRIEKNQIIAYRLLYFQGPRDHLANMLIWRKADSRTETDRACGQAGERHFFDPKTRSPLKPYLDVRERGWGLVGAKNLVVANKGQENHPCFQDLKQ